MKVRGLLVAGAVAALALPAVTMGANTRDAVTGGGQAFFGTNGEAGPGAGDTVAFTAKRAKGAEGSDAAVGQIQVNRRTTDQVKFHGTFDCLVVNGEPGSGAGYAYGSGEARDSTPFQLYVEDGGKGAMERNDMIMLFVDDDVQSGDGPCGFDDFDPDEDSISLSRGNVQVRNRDTTEDVEEESNGASALSFLGL